VNNLRVLHYGSVASLLALTALCLAWELWLAPAKLGLWWPMFKILPLLTPLLGLLHARRKTFQWSSFLSLAYFTEGVVRGWSDSGVSQQLALAEIALSLIWFFCAIYAAKALGPPRKPRV
jgi:uncharacterized membrane protein